MTTQLWAIVLTLIATSVASYGPILLKQGGAKGFLNVKVLGGLFLYGLSILLFLPALKGGEVSTLYPLISLQYVWVGLLSWKILGESITREKFLGMVLIIVGVTVIGLAG